MTTAELVEQARANRTGEGPRHMSADATHKALMLILEMLLDGIVHDDQELRLAGVVARSIAALIANLEDGAVVEGSRFLASLIAPIEDTRLN